MIYQNNSIKISNWPLLEKIKNSKKIPHALLFHGGEGVGKEFAAIEFAAYLNCLEPKNSFACRNCSSCTKIISNNHEYIDYIFPLPKGKISSKKDDISKSFTDKTLTEYTYELKEKLNDPFHEITINGANTILINSIRSIKRKVYQSIENNSYRAIIIFKSDKLCYPSNESANSLLKILEEPPARTIFILVTSKINLLLDTIKSRCIEFYFPTPNAEDFNKYNKFLDYTDIDLYRLFNGNIKYVKVLDNNFIDELTKLIKQYNGSFMNENSDIDLKLIAYIAKLSKNNQLLFNIFIQSLKCYYKDLINIKFNSEYKPIFPFLKLANHNSRNLNKHNQIDIIENFEKDCLINLNLELSLLNLFSKLKVK